MTHHLFAYSREALNLAAISVFVWINSFRRFDYRKTLYFFCFKAMFSLFPANYPFNAGSADFVMELVEILPSSRYHYLNRSIRLTLDHSQKKK